MRIARRTELMIRAGLIEEVRALIASAPETAAPFSTVGYREAIQFLRGEINQVQLQELISAATRRLAKRQRTFWRNEPEKRGWQVRPREQDQPVVTLQDRPAGSRRKVTQKGFRALDLIQDELIERLRLRIKQPLEGVEVWHVALRAP